MILRITVLIVSTFIILSCVTGKKGHLKRKPAKVSTNFTDNSGTSSSNTATVEYTIKFECNSGTVGTLTKNKKDTLYQGDKCRSTLKSFKYENIVFKRALGTSLLDNKEERTLFTAPSDTKGIYVKVEQELNSPLEPENEIKYNFTELIQGKSKVANLAKVNSAQANIQKFEAPNVDFEKDPKIILYDDQYKLSFALKCIEDITDSKCGKNGINNIYAALIVNKPGLYSYSDYDNIISDMSLITKDKNNYDTTITMNITDSFYGRVMTEENSNNSLLVHDYLIPNDSKNTKFLLIVFSERDNGDRSYKKFEVEIKR